LLAHNWANPLATLRSYELIAREVMPQFQGHAQATFDAARRAKEVRERLAAEQAQAVEGARVRYQAELAKRG
jgi:limonene 1,2-monooxygenase